MRITELHTGRSVRQLRLTQGEFGEGVALISVGGQQRVVQLTYQNGTAYEYPLSALLNSSNGFSAPAVNAQVAVHAYPPFVKEGWGLASWPDSDLLYMSDGSNTLHLLTANTLQHIRSVPIALSRTTQLSLVDESVDSPLSFNELELLSPDLLLANLYPTRCLALINLASARLLSVIQADNDGGRMHRSSFPALEVMNGIAYRPSDGSVDAMLLVTGKLWPLLYQVAIEESSEQTVGRRDGRISDLGEHEQLRTACPPPDWTAAEAEHAKMVVAAMQAQSTG